MTDFSFVVCLIYLDKIVYHFNIDHLLFTCQNMKIMIGLLYLPELLYLQLKMLNVLL